MKTPAGAVSVSACRNYRLILKCIAGFTVFLYRKLDGIFVYTTPLKWSAFEMVRFGGPDVMLCCVGLGMTNFHQSKAAAPMSTSRPILSPSFLLIGAAILAVVLLLTFRLVSA